MCQPHAAALILRNPRASFSLLTVKNTPASLAATWKSNAMTSIVIADRDAVRATFLFLDRHSRTTTKTTTADRHSPSFPRISHRQPRPLGSAFASIIHGIIDTLRASGTDLGNHRSIQLSYGSNA